MRMGTGPAPIPVVAVRTPARQQWLAPPGLWFPAAAMAASLLVAAAGGLTLGVLAALETGVADGRWQATVQAHGELQLWGWFAVFIVALLFEFIVRLNGRPPVPLMPRVFVLSFLGAGAVLSAAGRFADGSGQNLVTTGALSMVVGSLLLTGIVMRIPPAHPWRVDLHPLFFRAGALWLLAAAVAALAASREVVSGATSFEESHVVAEFFLRGFVMNVTIAVALRAFVGHLGLRPAPVARQRVLWGLVNGSIVVWVLGSAGFGLPGVASLAALGDLLFAAGVLWATWTLDLGRAVRAWRGHPQRAQVLVPVAWLGLLVYAVALSLQAVPVLAGGARPALFEAGATRHLLALGFVAPLLVAMAHVVLERFLIGRLYGERWLTAAFVLLVVAWPARVFPPLVPGLDADLVRGLMGAAGILTALALLAAAAVAAQNGIAAERYVRLIRRLEGAPPEGRPRTRRTHMHEIDVRADITAGREPFPRIMAAVRELGPGESLRLVAPFEPTPLYSVLAQQGFQHETEAQPDGSWQVIFRRGSQRA